MVYFKKMFHSDLEIRRFAIFQFIWENENLNLLSFPIVTFDIVRFSIVMVNTAA